MVASSCAVQWSRTISYHVTQPTCKQQWSCTLDIASRMHRQGAGVAAYLVSAFTFAGGWHECKVCVHFQHLGSWLYLQLCNTYQVQHVCKIQLRMTHCKAGPLLCDCPLSSPPLPLQLGPNLWHLRAAACWQLKRRGHTAEIQYRMVRSAYFNDL